MTESATPADARSRSADRPCEPALAGARPRCVAAFILVTVALLAADLWLKAWSFEHVAGEPVDVRLVMEHYDGHVPPHDEIVLVPKVLALKLTLNQGAVFGLGQGKRWGFIAFTVVAIAVIGYLFATARADQWLLHVTLAMILAGAVGNLYDRMMYAAVRDMFWLFPGVHLPFGWRWPGGTGPGARELYPWIFNAADAYLVVGIGSILVRSLVEWIGDVRRGRGAGRGC